jgi:hypothetical protein
MMASSSRGSGRRSVCRSQIRSLLMTTLLTRYHVCVAKKASEGEVPINVIL